MGQGHLRGCWNGDIFFWSSLGMINDALGSSDILFVTKTHVSRIKPLTNVVGYHWFSVFKLETRCLGNVRDSGRVACLVRDSL